VGQLAASHSNAIPYSGSNRFGFGWEIAHAAVSAGHADFPRRDCIPYPHVHVRRERLGFVARSRTSFCRPVPNLSVTIRNLCIAVRD
jgi:hypothetical protein